MLFFQLRLLSFKMKRIIVIHIWWWCCWCYQCHATDTATYSTPSVNGYSMFPYNFFLLFCLILISWWINLLVFIISRYLMELKMFFSVASWGWFFLSFVFDADKAVTAFRLIYLNSIWFLWRFCFIGIDD